MKKYSIVIVENDEDERKFIAEAFTKSEHFELRQICNNGNILVEWLDANPTILPEVILSDLNMPGMNGYDILEYTKQSSRLEYIPVIIMSTSSTPSIIEKCLTMGAANYISKPQLFIEYDEFAIKLFKMLEEMQQR